MEKDLQLECLSQINNVDECDQSFDCRTVLETRVECGCIGLASSDSEPFVGQPWPLGASNHSIKWEQCILGVYCNGSLSSGYTLQVSVLGKQSAGDPSLM